MRRRKVILLSSCALIVVLVGSAWGYWHWKYPYGRSHCCILGVMFALEQYASDNDGRYPSGESSAEASLSLLYRSGALDPHTLRGMTVPEATTRYILEGGGLLSPESCGWHYVEGLTRADDYQLALLWCKEPLGHNGDRTRNGGRQVVFVGGDVRWITGARWPGFLEDQKRLLAARGPRAIAGAPLVTGYIELPNGTQMDRLDCRHRVKEVTKGPDWTSSGISLDGLKLAWYHAAIADGLETRTLWFSNLVSAPVTVRFTNGVPDLTNVVFKMKPTR